MYIMKYFNIFTQKDQAEGDPASPTILTWWDDTANPEYLVGMIL